MSNKRVLNLRKIAINTLIPLALSFIFAVANDKLYYHSRTASDISGVIGTVLFLYFIGAIVMLVVKPLIGHSLDTANQAKAHKDILKYQKLLKENVITQEEYDKKAKELKKVLL